MRWGFQGTLKLSIYFILKHFLCTWQIKNKFSGCLENILINGCICFIYAATVWCTFCLLFDDEISCLKTFSCINLMIFLCALPKFLILNSSIVPLLCHFHLVCEWKGHFFFEAFFLWIENRIHDLVHLYPTWEASRSWYQFILSQHSIYIALNCWVIGFEKANFLI